MGGTASVALVSSACAWFGGDVEFFPPEQADDAIAWLVAPTEEGG